MAVALDRGGRGRRPRPVEPDSLSWLDEEPFSEPYSNDQLRERRRRIQRPRLGKPLVWLLAVVALLGGIVTLNLGAMRQQVISERLTEEIEKAQIERETLLAQLAKKRSLWKVQARARELRLGEAARVTHLDAPARSGAAGAAVGGKSSGAAGTAKQESGAAGAK